LEKTFDTVMRSTSVPNKSNANAFIIMLFVGLQYLSEIVISSLAYPETVLVETSCALSI
jgi:hypothetical protein